MVMVPDAWAFAGQFHVDWLGVAPVRAQVAAAILELLEVSDGVGAAGGGHSPHTKRKGHLNGDGNNHIQIQYRVLSSAG